MFANLNIINTNLKNITIFNIKNDIDNDNN